MKPAPFAYHRPDTLEEAVDALTDLGGEAKVLAGGQSLMPLLAFRLVRPQAVVDITAIPELGSCHLDGNTLRLGATVTHRTVETDQDLADRFAMIQQVLGYVGHVAIRNAGTVGGSHAHADPASEWATLSLLLAAQVRIVGASGSREVPIDDFFLDWMTTTVAVGEIITSIDLAIPPRSDGWGFREVARRAGDFALAGAGALISIEDGAIASARVALLGLAMTPKRSPTVERALTGLAVGAADLGAACAAVEDDIEPVGDQHATASFKAHLARVMTTRAVTDALGRAAVPA